MSLRKPGNREVREVERFGHIAPVVFLADVLQVVEKVDAVPLPRSLHHHRVPMLLV